MATRINGVHIAHCNTGSLRTAAHFLSQKKQRSEEENQRLIAIELELYERDIMAERLEHAA